MKKYTKTILFTFIISIAVIVRFYKLGDAPAGLYLDEASLGYSAYSILETGKDEFGKILPIAFRSFSDFKTPIYTYILVPLIPVFGLTKFTVRFPSFILSILTLFFLYLLINEITPKKHSGPIAFLSMLLLAISPWHILFARSAFECNIALFFFTAGSFFFFKSLKIPKYLPLSAGFLAISLIAYHAQRILIPILGAILFVKYKSILTSKIHIRYLVLSILVAIAILLPTISIINTPGFLARASGLNIFSQERPTTSGMISDIPGNLNYLINNRYYLLLKEFSSLYVAYFSPRNLFSLGDYDKRASYPELATFFVWQLPFYLLGLYKLVKEKELKELRFFGLTYFLISPLPAAVTRDPYSSIRSLQMVIPLVIIISLGIYACWQMLKSVLFKYTAIGAFLIIIIYSLTKLYSSVIILNEYHRAQEWNYGWQDVAEFIKGKDSQTMFVVDTARQGPYIELAFFLKHNPSKFQKENFEVTPEEYYVKMDRRSSWNLGNVTIKPIEWGLDLNKKQFLIGDSLAISDEQIKNHNLTLVKDILYPNKGIAFRIVETNPK